MPGVLNAMCDRHSNVFTFWKKIKTHFDCHEVAECLYTILMKCPLEPSDVLDAAEIFKFASVEIEVLILYLRLRKDVIFNFVILLDVFWATNKREEAGHMLCAYEGKL